MGGENCAKGPNGEPAEGSSPRGRGKRRASSSTGAGRGLIPAWAGKTVIEAMSCSMLGAHPRVGGENFPDDCVHVGVTGSSPRGRGKPFFLRRCTPMFRLIPAWAGKTANTCRTQFHDWAHPRVGGENLILGSPHIRHWGSSPRGRGKQPTIRLGMLKTGLIPAWAGKT